MKKLMLATTIALLVGATASPAFAVEHGRRAGGEASVQAASKGAAPEESREDSREDREDARDDRREARDAVRSGDRQALRDWAAANEGRQGPRADVRDVARPTGIARPPAQARPAPVLAQHGSGDRDGNRYDGRDGNRYDGRDGNRYDGRNDDRYGSRDGNRYDRDTYDRNRNYDWRNEWRNDRHDWRDGGRRDNNAYTRYRDARWSGYQWFPQYRYRAPTRYAYPYGYRPYRWSVGYRMPYGYYNSPSYILDWRAYRLPMPPMGYEWVRVDRDVVLVHMFSGYIRDVLYGLFY
jgi:Ni/Co efflux regulator RcnB